MILILIYHFNAMQNATTKAAIIGGTLITSRKYDDCTINNKDTSILHYTRQRRPNQNAKLRLEVVKVSWPMGKLLHSGSDRARSKTGGHGRVVIRVSQRRHSSRIQHWHSHRVVNEEWLPFQGERRGRMLLSDRLLCLLSTIIISITIRNCIIISSAIMVKLRLRFTCNGITGLDYCVASS